jgi:cobalt/nickel transport system permease protein
MHLSEGVLEWPVLASAAALSAFGVGLGLRTLSQDRLPTAAVLTAVFFVGGTVHIPVGIGSVHLVLTGLLGLLLGWAIFPVLLIGLFLQAVLLSFGGFAVLGANLLVLALPAALVGALLRPVLRSMVAVNRTSLSLRSVMGLGGLSAALSVGGSVLLVALLLWWSGGARWLSLIYILSVAHLPALLIDTAVTSLTVGALSRAAPDLCQRLLEAPRHA